MKGCTPVSTVPPVPPSLGLEFLTLLGHSHMFDAVSKGLLSDYVPGLAELRVFVSLAR